MTTPEALTDQQLADRLTEIDERCGGDPESAHGEADDLLVEVLRSLGYRRAMLVYEAMHFYYS